MPKIIITSKKPVLTAERGRLPKDVPVEVSDLLAKHLLAQGVAVLMETKAKMDRPIVAAGKMEPSYVLPVAPVLPMTTLTESSNGAKKRGRPRKIEA
jgi:hypothetical protein